MNDTRITKIETLRLGAYGNLVWVRVHTDAGVYGIGESFLGAESVEAQARFEVLGSRLALLRHPPHP